MHKISISVLALILFASCNKVNPIPPLPPDASAPTLSYPPTAFASTIKFIPFGDTLPGGGINKGYEIHLTDTTSEYISVDSGYVTAITALGNGSSTITVLYRRNSIYTMVYSGIRNLQVRLNDSIAPSTVLGRVGNSGIIDFKLIMNGNTAVCPQPYGSAGFNNGIATAIRQGNRANPTDTVALPCLVQSLAE